MYTQISKGRESFVTLKTGAKALPNYIHRLVCVVWPYY